MISGPGFSKQLTFSPGGGGRRAPRSGTSPRATTSECFSNPVTTDSYGYGPSTRSSGTFSSPYGSRSRSSAASSSRSPYSSSYGSGSSYGSHSSYDSARSFMTDYRPRSGWFSKRRSGNDYPPFPSDFARGGGSGGRQSYPRAGGRSRWSFGTW